MERSFLFFCVCITCAARGGTYPDGAQTSGKAGGTITTTLSIPCTQSFFSCLVLVYPFSFCESRLFSARLKALTDENSHPRFDRWIVSQRIAVIFLFLQHICASSSRSSHSSRPSRPSCTHIECSSTQPTRGFYSNWVEFGVLEKTRGRPSGGDKERKIKQILQRTCTSTKDPRAVIQGLDAATGQYKYLTLSIYSVDRNGERRTGLGGVCLPAEHLTRKRWFCARSDQPSRERVRHA